MKTSQVTLDASEDKQAHDTHRIACAAPRTPELDRIGAEVVTY